MQPRSILALVAIAGFVLAAGPPAHAAAYAWTGNSSTDWSDGDSWLGFQAGYPDGSGDTAMISTQGNGWPVLDNDYCIGSLTMNGGQLDMDDGTARTLKVDGTFLIGANGATLGGSGGTVEAETWTFNGPITFGEGTYKCCDVGCS